MYCSSTPQKERKGGKKKRNQGTHLVKCTGSCRMWRISPRDVIYGRPIYMCFEWLIWKLHAILTSRWCRLPGRLRSPCVTRPAPHTAGLHQSTSVYMTRLYAVRAAAKARDAKAAGAASPSLDQHAFRLNRDSAFQPRTFLPAVNLPGRRGTFRDLRSARKQIYTLHKQ